MKMILLMVLFSTPAEPLPHEEHGFAPRVVEDMATCLQRRSRLQAYLETIADKGTLFKAFCVEFQAVGYAEALAAFHRTIGEEM